MPSPGLVGSMEHARDDTLWGNCPDCSGTSCAPPTTLQQLVACSSCNRAKPPLHHWLCPCGSACPVLCMSRCCLPGEGQEIEWNIGCLDILGLPGCLHAKWAEVTSRGGGGVHMVSPPAITVGITLVIGAAGETSLPNASATAPPTTSAHFDQALVSEGKFSAHHAHGRLRGGCCMGRASYI